MIKSKDSSVETSDRNSIELCDETTVLGWFGFPDYYFMIKIYDTLSRK